MKRLNLLFDLDGTLTNNKEGIVRSVQFALDRLGVDLDDTDNLEWVIGPPIQESFAKLLGLERKHRVPEAVELYRERYREKGMFENRVYEGIENTLAELRQVSCLYVATSKPTVFSKMILKHFSMDKNFKDIYGSELDGTNTDKAHLIGYLLEKEKLQPETVVMIGDREHDMIGATKNQIAGVGVGWGFGSEEELITAGARQVLKTPADLLKYFLSYPN